jgi:hypothetical protein
MSQVLICNGCQQPIDNTVPYYALMVQMVQEQNGAPVVVTPGVTLDYHEDHLPTELADQLAALSPAPEREAATE